MNGVAHMCPNPSLCAQYLGCMQTTGCPNASPRGVITGRPPTGLVLVPSLSQRWIPVTEAQPKPEVFVLCWDGKQTFVEWFGSKPDAGRGVTHWMPYPMPPGSTSDMHDGRRAVV